MIVEKQGIGSSHVSRLIGSVRDANTLRGDLQKRETINSFIVVNRVWP